MINRMRFYFISLFFIGTKLFAQTSDTVIIENHLKTITKTDAFRNYENPETLDSVAAYIFNHFEKYCDTVFYQTYFINDVPFSNVVARINTHKQSKIIVGAHYDVCGHQEGADDNATGVVGLLELARMLTKDATLNHQIELVAYTLEEPPFFRSEMMGSAIHAKSVYENEDEIVGMVCLEMIGYFKMERKTQDYPLGILKLFYGSKGDYITVVQKFGPGRFAKKFNRSMKKQDLVKTKTFKGPKSLPGIDFSDHLNYWSLGYSALMITDTAFYRNKSYHKSTDTMDQLDLPRMSAVINQVYFSLKNNKL